jgi:hypothetical protein
MSGRRLQLARIERVPCDAYWSIESPTPGVVLIDVHVAAIEESVPLHWRTGTWTKPPLDISLDREGRLVGFQFVLQDERLREGTSSDLPSPEVGLPVFNIEDWPPDRYADESSPVDCVRLAGGELQLRLADEFSVRHVCQIGSGLFMAFGDDGGLRAIRLGPLSVEDWEAIDAFSHAGT